MRIVFKLSVSCVVVFELLHAPARAACSDNTPASNTAVTCTGADVTAVVAQPDSTNVSITLDPTVTTTLTRVPAAYNFQVDSFSTITNRGNLALTGAGSTLFDRAAVLGGVSFNELINDTSGLITTTGAYNDGMVVTGMTNTLTNAGLISTSATGAIGMSADGGRDNTLINTGTITATGDNARAMSLVRNEGPTTPGSGGTLRNDGIISTSGADSVAAYMSGNRTSLLNTGSISATGANADAVSSFTSNLSFTTTIENRTGGVIFSQNAAAVRTLAGAAITIINIVLGAEIQHLLPDAWKAGQEQQC